MPGFPGDTLTFPECAALACARAAQMDRGGNREGVQNRPITASTQGAVTDIFRKRKRNQRNHRK